MTKGFDFGIRMGNVKHGIMIDPIQNQIQREEFDYQTLLDVLKDYRHPRDKISDYLRKGVIIRIKKGLYIFGEDYRKKPYSRELLANLIYGPSYITLDYALRLLISIYLPYGRAAKGTCCVWLRCQGRAAQQMRRQSRPIGFFKGKLA